MGGGGGKQVSETHAEYPPEFRPLAESAVKQIQDLQNRLPLGMFTQYQPAGTAGLAPLQEFAINELVPATMRPTAGLQGMLQTPGAVGAAAQGATAAGGPTQASNAALTTLGRRLAGPVGQMPSTQPLQQAFASALPGNYSAPSIFPGMSEETIQGMGDMASRPIPILGGPGVTSITPTQSGQFPDPYAKIRGQIQAQMYANYLAQLAQQGQQQVPAAPPTPTAPHDTPVAL